MATLAAGSSARSGVAAVLAMILAVESAGCSHSGLAAQAQAACDASKNQASSASTAFEYEGGGRSHCAVVSPPGRYLVGAEVTWSNGWYERNEITTDLSARPGQRYAVVAYETGRGNVPAVAYLGEPTSAGGKALIAVVAAPVYLVMFVAYGIAAVLSAPFAIAGRKKESQSAKPRDRPSKDCCYVWLKDATTGDVIAGTPPPGSERPSD